MADNDRGGAIVEIIGRYGVRTHRFVALCTGVLGAGGTITAKTGEISPPNVGDRMSTTVMVAGTPIVQGHRITGISHNGRTTTITATTTRPSRPQ